MGLGLNNSIVYRLSTDFVSGNVMAESVTFELRDIYGNLMVTDNSTVGTLISKSNKV